MIKNISTILVSVGLSFSTSVHATAPTPLKKRNPTSIKKRDPSSSARPPQFVLLAFDGSSSLDMWKETVQFADTVTTTGIHGEKQNIRFSYFVNPTYYTEKAHKQAYQTPAVNKSTSCIGWAAPAGSVMERVQATNLAYAKGHEIGSHANSHCNAAGQGDASDPLRGIVWNEDHWTSEFSQFNNLFFNVLNVNQITPPRDFMMRYTQNDIIGFRAPALAVTPGLWPTLKKFKFKYDTSLINAPTYWPQRASWGGWNIPLARIKIARATTQTLSMDYNWFVYHTKAVNLYSPADCQKSENSQNRYC